MTVVPLPDRPCVRVALKYTQTDGYLGGNRFYLAYSGAAPNAAECTTLAGDIAGFWGSDCKQSINTDWALTEVDVLDIATNSGASGQWTGSTLGTLSGTPLPSQCASNVEFNIARRYRGGKPRIFMPPGVTGDLVDPGHYSAAFVTAMNTDFGGFFVDIQALTGLSMGTLTHVNLSYYSGFHNVTNSSGRTRAVPTYRATALSDVISGVSAKALVGSQRRRRNATTP